MGVPIPMSATSVLPSTLQTSIRRARLALECCMKGALAVIAERASQKQSSESVSSGSGLYDGSGWQRKVLPLIETAANFLQTFATTPLPLPVSLRRWLCPSLGQTSGFCGAGMLVSGTQELPLLLQYSRVAVVHAREGDVRGSLSECARVCKICEAVCQSVLFSVDPAAFTSRPVPGPLWVTLLLFSLSAFSFCLGFRTKEVFFL